MRGIIYGVFAALLSTSALANQGADGTWKTESSDDGGYLEVTMAACESDASQTCGTISKAHNGEGWGRVQ